MTPRAERKPLEGQGVFARKTYRAGHILGYFSGVAIDRDTQHSLTLDGCKIEPNGPLRFLNHSCVPNAAFRGRRLFALRAISDGEEITIDYLATEQAISHGFVCRCGAAGCRGRIGR